jgi:hypothetical protein
MAEIITRNAFGGFDAKVSGVESGAFFCFRLSFVAFLPRGSLSAFVK